LRVCQLRHLMLSDFRRKSLTRLGDTSERGSGATNQDAHTGSVLLTL
jgi:hypothetical protein